MRSSTRTPIAVRPRVHRDGPDVEIVVPVHNEEAVLAQSVGRLHGYLSSRFPWTYRITIADNASTDATWAVALSLATRYPNVRALRLDQKGRGRAINSAWRDSNAIVVAYMDVDLSTHLTALTPLVAPLLSGHSDLAIGTRLARGARVVRGAKREVISRIYNAILTALLRARFSDAQCGFKAVRADRARELLPLVRDTGWFFDTELLVLAERAGMRIHEVPVDWTDDPDSRVDLVRTAIDDLRGVARLMRGLVSGRIPIADLRTRLGTGADAASLFTTAVRFGAVGAASTIAYLAVFAVLRRIVPALLANAIALALTTIANTATNRAFTFGHAGTSGAMRQHVQAFVVLAIALGITFGSLVALDALVSTSGPALEGAVLVGANLSATVVRFVLLREWVFRGAVRVPDALRPLPK